jgi:uncharacterized membrane protein
MNNPAPDTSSTATQVAVDPSLVSYTHLVYALHAASILIGVLSSAFIVTAFVFGLPSIVAIIMNYVRRADVRGTWLDSHFRWQIRTFWTAAIALVAVAVVFGPLSVILIGLPFLLLGLFAIGVWAAYRIARGWLALKESRSLPIQGA